MLALLDFLGKAFDVVAGLFLAIGMLVLAGAIAATLALAMLTAKEHRSAPKTPSR